MLRDGVRPSGDIPPATARGRCSCLGVGVGRSYGFADQAPVGPPMTVGNVPVGRTLMSDQTAEGRHRA